MPAWFSKSTGTDRLLRLLACLMVLLPNAGHLEARPSLGSAGGLGTESGFLPVEEAFRWHVSRDNEQQLSVLWEIAPEYYLYREQFRFTRTDTGTELNASLPEGSSHHDAYFGDVEVYYDTVRATVQLPGDSPASLELQVRFQGCAEAGLCYPPQTETVTIEH